MNNGNGGPPVGHPGEARYQGLQAPSNGHGGPRKRKSTWTVNGENRGACVRRRPRAVPGATTTAESACLPANIPVGYIGILTYYRLLYNGLLLPFRPPLANLFRHLAVKTAGPNYDVKDGKITPTLTPAWCSPSQSLYSTGHRLVARSRRSDRNRRCRPAATDSARSLWASRTKVGVTNWRAHDAGDVTRLQCRRHRIALQALIVAATAPLPTLHLLIAHRDHDSTVRSGAGRRVCFFFLRAYTKWSTSRHRRIHGKNEFVYVRYDYHDTRTKKIKTSNYEIFVC